MDGAIHVCGACLSQGQPYGTRSQVAIAVQHDGHAMFFENYLDSGTGQWQEVVYDFNIRGTSKDTKNDEL